jgi:hypothetical protein
MTPFRQRDGVAAVAAAEIEDCAPRGQSQPLDDLIRFLLCPLITPAWLADTAAVLIEVVHVPLVVHRRLSS